MQAVGRTPRSHSARVFRSLAVAVLALAASGCGETSSRPSVLLITIDTLRPDALGWVAGTNETPAIDALAREGARFRTAVTTVPLTLPSHVSLMTGRLPHHHGVRDNGQVLAGGPPTLAESLHARGYATGAFVSGYPLRALFGLDRGFDRYDDVLPGGVEGWVERPATDTTAAALAWLGTVKAPWFLWVHYYDPHDPYTAHDEFPRTGPRGAYDSEVAYVDHAVGTLLHALPRGPLLTVLTADHAESFGEHGEWLHGFFVYDTTMVVPLLVRFPGRVPSADRESMVGLVDVTPTIRDLLGLPVGPDIDGASFVPALLSDTPPADTVRLETLQPWIAFGWSPLRAVRTAQWKLIDAPRPELYDLQRDPEETRNVIAQHDAEAQRLRDELPPFASDRSSIADRVSDPAVQARLEALGYLSTATTPAPPSGLPDPKDRLTERRALLEGEGLLRKGAFAEAVARFDAVLASDPGNRFAILRAGMALLKAGDPNGAAARLERAVAIAPELAEAHYALADALTRTRRYEAAIPEWQETTRLQPRRVAAWSNLGTVLGLVGRLPDARAALEHALALGPEDPRLLVNLALVERRVGDDAAAAGHLLEAARRTSTDAFLFSGTLGLVLARLGRRDEAQRWLARARTGETEFASSRVELARLLDTAGDGAGAAQALAEALAAAPELRADAAADPQLGRLLR
jgi:choline-sulfatase